MPKDIGLDEMRRLVDEGAQVVEVLPRREYDEEHSPGDVNIPLKALNETTAAQLDKARPVVVYCRDCPKPVVGRRRRRLRTRRAVTRA